METKTWTMPEHLEPYRDLINNTGGNTIEELMDVYHNQENIMRTNMILGVLAVMCAGQIQLLQTLYRQNLLKA